MVTPKIITGLYWILLAMTFLGGIGMIFSGGTMSSGVTAESLIRGGFSIVFGVIFTRIFCELTIILFRINEALQDLRQNANQG